MEKDRNGAPLLERVSKAGPPTLLDRLVDEEDEGDEKRRPGAADGSSAQSLKRPSRPREASRFG